MRSIIGGVFTGNDIKLLAMKVTQRHETIWDGREVRDIIKVNLEKIVRPVHLHIELTHLT